MATLSCPSLALVKSVADFKALNFAPASFSLSAVGAGRNGKAVILGWRFPSLAGHPSPHAPVDSGLQSGTWASFLFFKNMIL